MTIFAIVSWASDNEQRCNWPTGARSLIHITTIKVVGGNKLLSLRVTFANVTYGSCPRPTCLSRIQIFCAYLGVRWGEFSNTEFSLLVREPTKFEGTVWIIIITIIISRDISRSLKLYLSVYNERERENRNIVWKYSFFVPPRRRGLSSQ